MKKITFTIRIDAPKQKVWDVMLADKTYREWTTPFYPGSYYEGSWDKGAKIRFVAGNEGKLSGMTSRIAENIPYEYISIEHLGQVVDGVDDTTSEMAKLFAGAHENYRFSEEDGMTTLTVEMEDTGMPEDMKAAFQDMWPRALAILKEIAED